MTELDPTPPENEHSAQIDEAARWLAPLEPHEVPQPIVPALQARFGLTAQQACDAIQEARR
jgi:hypothetical protein